MGLFTTIRNAWKIADLRKKMFFTLLMIFIFRLGSFIPVPGLNPDALKSMVDQGTILDSLTYYPVERLKMQRSLP